MQRGFTKLFNTIVTSTIWTEDNDTRILWITMLALSDRFGEVSGSVPGLAQVANITEEACRSAITKLEAPDKDSRTQDDEGRRIRPVDGGWFIINYHKYRSLLNDEQRREYKAKWIKTKRLDEMSTAVDKRRQAVDICDIEQKHRAEAEAEAVPKHQEDVLVYAREISLSDSEAAKFFDHFQSNGWKVSGKSSMRDWKAALRNWQRNSPNFSPQKLTSQNDSDHRLESDPLWKKYNP